MQRWVYVVAVVAGGLFGAWLMSAFSPETAVSLARVDAPHPVVIEAPDDTLPTFDKGGP